MTFRVATQLKIEEKELSGVEGRCGRSFLRVGRVGGGLAVLARLRKDGPAPAPQLAGRKLCGKLGEAGEARQVSSWGEGGAVWRVEWVWHRAPHPSPQPAWSLAYRITPACTRPIHTRTNHSFRPAEHVEQQKQCITERPIRRQCRVSMYKENIGQWRHIVTAPQPDQPRPGLPVHSPPPARIPGVNAAPATGQYPLG